MTEQEEAFALAAIESILLKLDTLAEQVKETRKVVLDHLAKENGKQKLNNNIKSFSFSDAPSKGETNEKNNALRKSVSFLPSLKPT